MYFGECSTKPIYIRKLGSLTYNLKSIQYFYRGKISLYPRNNPQCSTLHELQHPKSRTFTLRQDGISVTTTYFISRQEHFHANAYGLKLPCFQKLNSSPYHSTIRM